MLNDLFQILGSTEQRDLTRDLTQYLTTHKETVSQENLIAWWCDKRTELPVLYKRSLFLLSVPVSSAPVEGSFNMYKHVNTKDRGRMGKIKREKVTLMHYNKAL